MTASRSTSRRQVSPAAVLFLIVGTVGGGVGGASMGFWLGQRSRATAVPSVQPDAGRPGLTPAPSSFLPAARLATVDLGRSGDGGRSASDMAVDRRVPGGPGSQICVEVRDVGERRVAGALVTWRSVVPVSLQRQNPVGELGVFAAPLPFPEDVIARTGPLPGPAGGPSLSGSGSTAVRTDAGGRACIRAEGHILLTATSDERSASVEVDLPAGAQPAGVIVLRLAIPADALCRLAGPIESGMGETSTEPVSTQPAGDIDGRVVDARGFGIAGVRVDAQIGSARAVAVSDARGSFRLANLPRGALTFALQKRGYAPLTSTRRADEPRHDVELTLQAGGGIAGVLQDRQRGMPPMGASLSLQSGGSSQPVPLSRDGSFSLTGLASGAAVLRARAPGFAPLSLSIDIPQGQSPDEITLRDLRLELEAGASLRGQVRGSAGSLTGVSLTATTDDGSVVGRALSDDRGEFQMADLPAGKLRISATSAAGRGSTAVELRAGRQEQLQIDLQ